MATELTHAERILQKADDLFRRYGIRSVTMDEIAKQLSMSKKTLYQYFADKDAIVDAVFAAHIQKDEIECVHQKENSANAVDEIFMVIDMIEEMFSNMNPSILYDIKKYHPKTDIRFTEHKNKFIYNLIKENLERGIAEGMYRDNLNVDILSRFRVESMLLPFSPEFYTQHKYNLAEVETALAEHYLHGLASAKGVKMIEKYKQQRAKKKK
jgi:TetR/AcrR family transcriptional regulator, cholesterol catabolism regulator